MMRRRLLTSLITVSLIAKPMADYIQPASALIVFDPSNYAQNVLTAARSLEQINNQIQSLQNQATMLQNMARNLQRLDFSSVGQLTGALRRVNGLMEQASGLSFDLDQLQDQWRKQYPESYDAAIKVSDVASAARERWHSAMQAFRQTMGVQSQIVENVRADGDLLADLVNRSQGAAGSLQASQATNQLIALSTKQQMQIQTLLATQFRAEAEDAARKAQSEEAARETTRRFLGSGTAYSGN
ncbi:P-type conjugative transfer protein TrbJ [Mesorhizobium temperatum]|uniref:P-type conjugative transfer protein TrbJ n=1 Tax=Mesorhizobium temperatum TaxID=241416 RepID=A0A271LEN4_9HYPH|nr:P-type conjugative transfer protein TrbJ [Mesorhizobium temperatum]PAQ06572.1 P-type conjugative transfer protein TrbJ [Mesorhizobium temperatum]